MNEQLPFEQITNFKFEIRPIPIPPDLRPLWKISQILLVLKICSRADKASILKLQLFNWALGSPKAIEQLKKYILFEDRDSKPTTIHLDPSVNRAVEFAVGEGLIDFDRQGKISLTPKGDLFVQQVIADEDLFVTMKRELDMLGGAVTEAKVTDILKA
jgi:hypothetical protein